MVFLGARGAERARRKWGLEIASLPLGVDDAFFPERPRTRPDSMRLAFVGRLDGSNVVWDLDRLPAGKASTLSMKVRPAGIGTATVAASASARCVPTANTECATEVAGIPAILPEVVDTVEAVYEIAGQTVAISLLDVCAQSVSAVYHFYDPDFADRSLGVHSVLAEIEWTRQIGVPHYYLGFWVEGAATMDYKAAYRPHELLVDGVWRQA